MASIKSNTAIAFFVDGLEVKTAKLSSKKGSIVLDELESLTLASRLDEGRGVEGTTLEPQQEQASEGFGMGGGELQTDLPGVDNNSVFLGVLSKYPVGKYVVSYAISEPSIYYHTFETDFGLQGKKLRKRISDELSAVRSESPSNDAIDHFYSSDNNLICLIREDGLSIIDILEEIKPYTGKRLPRIPLVDSSDIALLNLARANFGFAPEEITAIIYIGNEYTRIIFLKGSDFLHFAPVIGEGFDSTNIQNITLNRLMLELDNLALPRVDRILLAGECKKIQFDDFIKDHFAEIDIQFLSAPYLDVSQLSAEVQERVSEFAVPIATAWKALDSKHPAFYQTNLLPETIRDQQRSFKLGWHGYLLLAMVFLLTLFFTYRFGVVKNEIAREENTMRRLQLQLAEVDRLKGIIGGIDDEIGRFRIAMNVYDSLVPGYDRWTKTIETMANGVEDIRSLWFTDVGSMPDGGIEVSGYALYRARIPRISTLFDNTTLRQVIIEPIREDAPQVYKFNFTAPPPPPPMKDTTKFLPDTTTVQK
ncbi:MAG: hypothetical protein HYZ33_03320 [Ignavibacteriales bacterium]|nr:hypothetical protein [Ignavibacteriales bacterium]